MRLEPREHGVGGVTVSGERWIGAQLPPSVPAGFVLELNELLMVAFWSCFSSVSTSKGKEQPAKSSPLTLYTSVKWMHFWIFYLFDFFFLQLHLLTDHMIL